MIRVQARALPRGFDAEWIRDGGERAFCEQWDYRVPDDSRQCSGTPEVEITVSRSIDRTLKIHLCREHASQFAREIEECVLLVDGRDLMEMGREP